MDITRDSTIGVDDRVSPSVTVPALLLLLALSLIVFQYKTLAKFGVLPPGRSFAGPLRYYQAVAERVAFDFFDGLLLALVLIAGVALVGFEVYGRRLSHFLAAVFRREVWTRLLLLLASAVSVRYYFAAGEFSWAGDAPHHLALAWVTAESLSHLEIPIWTYYFGAGSPYLQFYGPLFFLLTGAVDLLFGDIYRSIKLVLGTAHMLSGFGLYLLARRLGCRRAAALLAGLAYVLCFWHVQQVLVMGRFALGIFYALLPWPFVCFERLRSSQRPLAWAFAGGASLSALVYTHPGYGFFALVLFGLYAVCRLASVRPTRRRLGHCVLLLGVGLVLSAYLLLGMLLERGDTGLGGMDFGLVLGGKGAGAGVPDPTWQHLLVWSNYRFWLFAAPSNWYGGYLGISVVALAAVGLCWVFKRRSLWAVGLCCIAALALVFAHGAPPLRYIEVVQAMNSARFLLFVAFFLALCCGFGVRALQLRFRGVFTLLLLAVCIDLGPTTLQQPYVPAGTDDLDNPQTMWYRYRTEASTFRSRGELPPYRISWLRGAVSHFTAVGFLPFASRVPTPDILLSADLAPGRLFSQPLLDFTSHIVGAADRFEGVEKSPPFTLAKAGFAMLNVRHLLLTWSDGSIRPLQLAADSPVLVAPRIEGYTLEELQRIPYAEMAGRTPLSAQDPDERAVLRALWTIEKTGVDIDNKRAARILLQGGDTRELRGRPEVKVLEHRVENQRVELVVETSAPCFARLAYAYYPHMDVLVNGVKVDPMQTVGGFIALELGRGRQQVELLPRLSFLRRGLLWLNGLVLLVGIVLIGSEHRQIKNKITTGE